MKILLLFTSTALCLQIINAQTTYDYLGQTPPGNKAVIFAPGIISLSNREEYQITFSPDGNECFYSVVTGGVFKILYTKRINNAWTDPVKETYSANREVTSPLFSSDGNRLYFAVYNANYTSSDLYFVERTETGWGGPQILPSPINSPSWEFNYSESDDGVGYFISNRTGGHGNGDIWFINPSTGQAENLGSTVNTTSDESNLSIAPDGSYFVFGNPKIFICFNNGAKGWTKPIDINSGGANINSNQFIQHASFLSHDGKYLFFGRHTSNYDTADIYWVSTHIIDTLKKIAMPATLVNQAIDKKVMLYPNPTKGHITLSLGTYRNHESLVEIYNLQGALVFSKTFQNSPSATIDLTGNSAGMYVVKVIADGVSYEEKIVKE